ncbi:MAG: homocysteine S-methyltransferase family protein [Clostridiales bacterium]|nr:homocysteine S-methyltransferase family protein [Clostridiales bacterium]
MDIRKLLGKRIIFYDGATGTFLQEHGLAAGEFPEYWNLTNPEVIIEMHQGFLEAGSDIILTNTFGVNRFKFHSEEFSVKNIVTAAVENAKKAVKNCGREAFISLDIGPTGKLLKPMGDLAFEDACDAFGEVIRAGVQNGIDLITIETMSDTYEMKAAVLAAKENSALPIFATMIFDEKGKLLTGGDVPTVVAMLEGLGVDALGVNCGLGPSQMEKIVEEILQYASVPVIVNPNAGLPRSENGHTVFDVSPQEFAECMRRIVAAGAWIVGGCCGTTTEHIKAMVDSCREMTPKAIEKKMQTLVTSYSKAVTLGDDPIIIGERINPTGKPKFKQALRENNIDYILKEGLAQQEKGAHILDVNVGLPDISEEDMMETVVQELQSIIDLPLQIDTTNIQAMEKALRIYNGKAMVNSVNGKEEVMQEVFPLVKKYGGVVIGLTIDESGIPQTAEERVKIAEKIIRRAADYGIDKKDLVIDVLTMTVSSEEKGAVTTLEALRRVRNELKVNTVLGVSNISFGLPARENINAAFYTMALQNGLTSAIINPNAEGMMKAFHSYRALMGYDKKCEHYIELYANQPIETKKMTNNQMDLSESIKKGVRDTAKIETKRLLETKSPLDIINEELIPALDVVGKGFENGTVFLPQLLMSAEAAKDAFEIIKGVMDQSGLVSEKKGKIIIATVKGDIHDIGKNIVKVLLENYSYDVIDLGKDVPSEKIVEEAVNKDVKLVGLSALMTTTVGSMEETILKLKEKIPDCKIMVGGAVLTQEYANRIHADAYCKDAMASVHYAQEVL